MEKKEQLENLRNEIAGLVSKFAAINYAPTPFVGGETVVPPSGKLLGEEEMQYMVAASLDAWLTTGRFNAEFEKKLAAFLGVKYCLSVNSGSSANLVAFTTLTSPKLGDRAIKKGDEVIGVAAGFPTTVNPIVQFGAIPVFVDVDIKTHNVNADLIEAAITPKTKAIMLAHALGNPFNLAKVTELCKKYNLWLIEDTCDALGAEYNGQKCGTFGDIGVLSFNGNKIITTSGGGAIVTKTKVLKDKAVFYATQARDSAPHYQHSEIGYNYRMSNICAGIGRGQMEVLDAHVNLRRKMHAFYVELFKGITGVTVFKAPNADYFSNHWLSAILVDPIKTSGISRETLRLAFEAANIESRPLWKPMHLQPVFEKYPYYGNKVAETLFENGLCLPSGSNLTEEERGRIAEVVMGVFG